MMKREDSTNIFDDAKQSEDSPISHILFEQFVLRSAFDRQVASQPVRKMRNSLEILGLVPIFQK